MSRTAEDWKRLLAHAVKMRSLVRELSDMVDEWPEIDYAESLICKVGTQLTEMRPLMDELVGRSYIDWAHEDE